MCCMYTVYSRMQEWVIQITPILAVMFYAHAHSLKQNHTHIRRGIKMASDHVDALNQAGEDRTSEPRSSASCLQAASSREKTKKCKVFVGNISFYVSQ